MLLLGSFCSSFGIGVVGYSQTRIPLEGEWRYQPGNDRKYASPTYEDKSWQTIDLPGFHLLPIAESGSNIKEGLPEKGYVWFRKTISIDSLPDEDLFLQIENTHVDRIYVNGSTIGQTGEFPPLFRSGWLNFRSYRIPQGWLKQGENLIAIQLYYNLEVWISGPMEIVSKDIGDQRELYYRIIFTYFIAAFCVILLFFSTLLFYYFLRRRHEREYLFLSLSSSFLVLAFSYHLVLKFFSAIPATTEFVLKISQVGLLSFILFLSFFFQFYFYKKISLTRVFVSSCIIVPGIMMILIARDWHSIMHWRGIFLLVSLLLIVETLVTLAKQVRNKHPDSLIMLLGVLPVVVLGLRDILLFALEWIDGSIAAYIYGFPMMVIIIGTHLINRSIGGLNELEAVNLNLRHYETIIYNSTNGIFRASDSGEFLTVNPALVKILGFDSVEDFKASITNVNAFPFESDEDKTKLNFLITENLPVKISECVCHTKDSSIVTLNVNIQAVKDKHTDERYFEGIVEDITDKIVMQRIEREKEIAEKSNHLKSVFLANISHEIRTPMQGILGYSKLGMSRMKNTSKEKLHGYFGMVHSSGIRLLSLLNDILDLSKLESGKNEYEFENKELTALVNEAINEFTVLAEEKEIKIALTSNSPAKECVMDSNRIFQVLRNLISNAVKFSEENSQIEISVTQNEEHVKFAIADQGVGIPEDELDTIFDKFVQSSKTKTNSGGTGLGLAICKEIIKAHKGDIWAEQNPSGGAILSFTLPCESAADVAI